MFFTDALSVLEGLSGDTEVGQTERQTPSSLPGTPSESSVGILSLWYPDELTDQLTKLGVAIKHQTDNQVTLHEQKTPIKATRKQRPERDDYHLLGRAEQVIIFRLRTGHCRLKQHMYRKLKIAPISYCQCGQVEQTMSHILQDCPLLDQHRWTTWH